MTSKRPCFPIDTDAFVACTRYYCSDAYGPDCFANSDFGAPLADPVLRCGALALTVGMQDNVNRLRSGNKAAWNDRMRRA